MREDKVIHIICGKPRGKASGKGWEKRGKRIITNGEKWRDMSYPRAQLVIPKVIHSVFHVAYKIFIQKSTASTITTININN